MKKSCFICVVLLPFCCCSCAQSKESAAMPPFNLNLRSDQVYINLDHFSVYFDVDVEGLNKVNCPSSKRQLLARVHGAGKPENYNGSDVERDMLQSSIMEAFRQYSACQIVSSKKIDISVATAVLPWILNNKNVVVGQKPDLSKRMPITGNTNPQLAPRVQRVPESIDGGTNPHAGVTTPEGVLIGWLIAEGDPPSDKNDSRIDLPHYVVDDKGPIFTRKFDGDGSQDLRKDEDVVLEICASDTKIKIDNPAQTIVDGGQPQKPIWKISPVLAADSVDYRDGDVQLKGIVTVYPAGDHNKSLTHFGVSIPNGHFIIRKFEIRQELIEGFLTAVPRWILLIEAAIVAVWGFVRLKWLKEKQKNAAGPDNNPDGSKT